MSFLNNDSDAAESETPAQKMERMISESSPELAQVIRQTYQRLIETQA